MSFSISSRYFDMSYLFNYSWKVGPQTLEFFFQTFPSVSYKQKKNKKNKSKKNINEFNYHIKLTKIHLNVVKNVRRS